MAKKKEKKAGKKKFIEYQPPRQNLTDRKIVV